MYNYEHNILYIMDYFVFGKPPFAFNSMLCLMLVTEHVCLYLNKCMVSICIVMVVSVVSVQS